MNMMNRTGILMTLLLSLNFTVNATTEAERQLEIKQRTDAKVNQSDEGLVSVTHADGTVSLDLQGRFQNFSKVVVDENGNKHYTCNMHPDIEHISHNADGSPKVTNLEAVPK